MKTIDLHIFTNSTINAPSTDTIITTYNSFCNAFKTDIKPTIWCDVHPVTNVAKQYIKELIKVFGNCTPTKSLSDGYVKAIKQSKSDFLFMLEHDWIFLPTIKNSLEQIIDVMQSEDIMHLRFNKRKNKVIHTDKWLKEKKSELFYYCETPSVSNNPHIINKQKYIEKAFPLISIKKGSLGLEHKLNDRLIGTIYGPLDYSPTVAHLDGRLQK